MKLVFSFVLACFGLLALQAQQTAVQAGKLVDVRAGTVREQVTIIVEADRVKEVRDGYHDAEVVIDLKDAVVLPGLIDMHTHLDHEMHEKRYIERFVQNPADYALVAAAHARRTLMAGFTTVRDLGDAYNVTVSLRNAIARGLVPGPRIFTSAKSLATTGGHADPTNGYASHLMGRPGPREGVVNGVAAAREAVRQRYKDGADLIKLTATGGVLSLAKSGDNPQFMADELQAIVATAKDYDMAVTVHAHGAEGMKRAVLAGVDSIEHGTYLDDEVIALMKERGVYLVPTISAGMFVAEKARVDGYFPEVVRPKAARIGPMIQDTFAKAYRAGVPIAFGTDSGVSPHGDNAREFVFMVEAGMPAMEAIRCATVHAAKLLRAEEDLGVVEAGKYADLIAVRGDPLADVSLLQSVAFVMKGGEVYKHEEGP